MFVSAWIGCLLEQAEDVFQCPGRCLASCIGSEADVDRFRMTHTSVGRNNGAFAAVFETFNKK